MSNATAAPREINAVLRTHDRELLKLLDVVGVYLGVLAKSKQPCLMVRLARHSPATERAIPKLIESYRVALEITGEIRPIRGRKAVLTKLL